MQLIKPLPTLMVAPNGARKMKTDHSAVPITIPETVAVAKQCYEAGAQAIHLHVRDADGNHTLDTGLYKEAIKEINLALPQLSIQITTEAVGIYTPVQQREVVQTVKPEFVSISLSEMLSDGDITTACEFYKYCTEESIAVQHILYEPSDLQILTELLDSDALASHSLQLMFVLGRYTKNQESEPSDLLPFTNWLNQTKVEADWALCAFGKKETDCLTFGLQSGGKVRVGFENSFWNANGTLASGNHERVAELKAIIDRERPST